jgi:hypothetical protein
VDVLIGFGVAFLVLALVGIASFIYLKKKRIYKSQYHKLDQHTVPKDAIYSTLELYDGRKHLHIIG